MIAEVEVDSTEVVVEVVWADVAADSEVALTEAVAEAHGDEVVPTEVDAVVVPTGWEEDATIDEISRIELIPAPCLSLTTALVERFGSVVICTYFHLTVLNIIIIVISILLRIYRVSSSSYITR